MAFLAGGSYGDLTRCLDGPEDYAHYVVEHEKLAASRLSRLSPEDHAKFYSGEDHETYQASVFGDCHADERGDVGEPFKTHRHYGTDDDGEPLWKKDNEEGTRKLLTQTFLVWDKPRIITKKELKLQRPIIAITARAFHESQTKMWEKVSKKFTSWKIL